MVLKYSDFGNDKHEEMDKHNINKYVHMHIWILNGLIPRAFYSLH